MTYDPSDKCPSESCLECWDDGTGDIKAHHSASKEESDSQKETARNANVAGTIQARTDKPMLSSTVS